MSHVKSVFTIKDLEHLSGIKAHTIRIWERRYNILQPSRTQTNIRYYNSENLQKLLNVVLLVKYGIKLPRLAAMSLGEIEALVLETRSEKYDKNHVAHQFKVAMVSFDQQLFVETYETLLKGRSFRQVFSDYFMPLLDDIGVLWQTRTITPAHEHFISALIRSKIIAHSDPLRANPREDAPVYVLFLPIGEIHELGLLYLNYELLCSGLRTIYLGENMPVESLCHFKSAFSAITFVTYATVAPPKSEFSNYLANFQQSILQADDRFWVLGAQVHDQPAQEDKRIRFFNSIPDVLREL